MSNEGIRLPSDSTVASQKVHRGSTAPEVQVPIEPSKSAIKPSPLLTVVLQSQTLIQGKNGSLYELLIQNDPKSASPIRVQTETDIKPGTSLLLELDENQQYKPVEKPSNEQLIKLVKLELDFWRAHLLPKTDVRSFPELPTRESLLTLANSIPNLKPLIQWLVQSNTVINAQTIGKLIESFAPMASLRPQIPSQIADLQNRAPINFNVQRLDESVSNPHAGLTKATQSTTTFISRTNDALSIPIITTLESKPSATIIDSRLAAPVGTQAIKQAYKLEQTLEVINTLRHSIDQTSLGSSREAQNSPLKLELSSQLFRLADAIRGQTNATAIHEQTFVRANAGKQIASQSNASTQASLSNQQALMNSTPANKLPTAPVIQSPNVLHNQLPTQLSAAIEVQPATKNQIQSNASLTNASVTEVPGLAKSFSSERLQTFSAPSLNSQIDSRIPSELKVGLWLKEVDKLIAQSPPHLHAQLKQKATELLQQTLSSDSKITQSTLATPSLSSEKEELPLIALRNWLDATQARLQNATINNALHQWSFPETIVQQMQLPLIWLGLTGWADIEWWQEKPKRKDSDKKTEAEKRRWRLRVFLTLDPLAQTCADIDWASDRTNITFWSEDSATLAHLNQLLPTLDTWTQGLGEKSLTTKHGMPKKASENTQSSNSENHLVDIRT